MHFILDLLQAAVLLIAGVVLLVGAMAAVGHWLTAKVPPREFDH